MLRRLCGVEDVEKFIFVDGDVMNKKRIIMVINAVIIGVVLIVASFFVDDMLPFFIGASVLNILNIIVFHPGENKNTKD